MERGHLRLRPMPFLAVPRQCFRGAPPAFVPGEGAVRGPIGLSRRRGCKTRAHQLRARPEVVSPVPGLPQSARPAEAPSPRKRLTAPARPGSLRPPSGAGWLNSQGKGPDGHSGRDTPCQRAGKPFLAADESLRSASPPFYRKSNSGNVVPYLPAQLPPLTFALWKLGQKSLCKHLGLSSAATRHRSYSSGKPHSLICIVMAYLE